MFRSLTALRSRRWAWLTWVSIWVFSLSALMPAISGWVASSRSAGSWIEVCSIQGTKWVQAQSDKDASPDGKGHLYGSNAHCAFCLLQQHAPALPAQPAPLTVAALATVELLPTLFLRSPRTLFAWSPLSARAPPLSA